MKAKMKFMQAEQRTVNKICVSVMKATTKNENGEVVGGYGIIYSTEATEEEAKEIKQMWEETGSSCTITIKE